jgi:hypothetical protein
MNFEYDAVQLNLAVCNLIWFGNPCRRMRVELVGGGIVQGQEHNPLTWNNTSSGYEALTQAELCIFNSSLVPLNTHAYLTRVTSTTVGAVDRGTAVHSVTELSVDYQPLPIRGAATSRMSVLAHGGRRG